MKSKQNPELLLKDGEADEARDGARRKARQGSKESAIKWSRVACRASLVLGHSRDAFEDYEYYRQRLGHHDFSMLRELSRLFLQEASSSWSVERRLRVLQGCTLLDSDPFIRGVLQRSLEDSNVEVRQLAVRVLERCSFSSLRHYGLALQEDPSPEVRVAFVRVLGDRFKHSKSAEANTLLNTLRDMFRNDRNEKVKAKAARILASASALPDLKKADPAWSWEFRLVLADIRSAHGEGHAWAEARKFLDDRGEEGFRELFNLGEESTEAVESLTFLPRLAELGHAPSQRALSRCLEAAAPPSRISRVLEGLYKRPVVRYQGEVESLLEHFDPYIRAGAMRTLAKYDKPRASKQARTMLEKDASPVARSAALEALETLGGLETSEIVAWVRKDPETFTEVGFEALERRGSPSLTEIARMLGDPSPIKERAVQALVNLGGNVARETLRQLFKTSQGRFRQTVLAAIRGFNFREHRALYYSELGHTSSHSDLDAATALLKLDQSIGGGAGQGHPTTKRVREH